MPNSRLRVEVRQELLVDLGLLAMLALFIGIVTVGYISQEHNFHWWIDWYARTLDVVTTFRESPWEAFELVQYSLIGERNRLFTLPLIPFFLVFGSSRLVYELGLALVYLLPFCLAMGAIATQLIRTHSRTVFWATAFLTLLVPVTWIPTFMGIPDTGGAAFMSLATFVYLQDVRLKRWWRIPLIGFLIAAAILLRRPFVYAGAAFFAALILQTLIFFVAEVRKQSDEGGGGKGNRDNYPKFFNPKYLIPNPNSLAWRNLLVRTVRIALIGATALVTLLIVAPQFTYAALTRDYKTLYTSWSLPFSDIFNLYASFYGWGTWMLVVLGLFACLVIGTLACPEVSFIGLSGVISLYIWLVVLRYGNVFYSLQITPLVVIGLVAHIWTTWLRLKGKRRSLMLGVAGCYLVANFVVGLTPVGTQSRVFHPLFALSVPPLVRTDYDEVVRLVQSLRQLTSQGEPIFVVGHQRLQLTAGMVRAAQYLLYPEEDRSLNILPTPEVDSRDSYPLEGLIEAQYVVIPSRLPDYSSDPTKIPAVGEWLPNTEHDVVKVVFDAFSQKWEFTRDFTRLPVQFNFENDVVVSIYQRTRPTSLATAVRTLEVMQHEISQRPGSQNNWIVLSQWVHNTKVKQNSYNTYDVLAFRRDRPWGEEEGGFRLSESTILAKELGLQAPSGRDSQAVAAFDSKVSSPSALPKVSLVRALRNQELQQQNSTVQLLSAGDSIPRRLEGNFASNSTTSQQEEEQNDRELSLEGRDSKHLLPEPSADRTQQLGTSLLYLGLVPNRAKISGAITYMDRACVGSFVRVAMLDSDGQILSSTESAYNLNPKKVTKFELSISQPNSAYLLFNILNSDRQDLVNSCTMQINPLKVSAQK